MEKSLQLLGSEEAANEVSYTCSRRSRFLIHIGFHVEVESPAPLRLVLSLPSLPLAFLV